MRLGRDESVKGPGEAKFPSSLLSMASGSSPALLNLIVVARPGGLPVAFRDRRPENHLLSVSIGRDASVARSKHLMLCTLS